ncbi:MAG: hypothetical protein GY805_16720 [Chloroflexi bacterium]|nr:hypothetical protein [Chloroflexota bacterium]
MSFAKRIVAEVERWLSVVIVTEQDTTNLVCGECLGRFGNGRAFTGQLVPQQEKIA